VLSLLRRLPRPSLFPYTTLFRSDVEKPLQPFGKVAPESPARRVDQNKLALATCAIENVERGHCHPARRRVHGVEPGMPFGSVGRSEEHTSELQSREKLVCRLLLE